MSITLITGVPGSGKTLYTVDKLLRPLVGSTIDKTLDSGEVIKLPRTIYTNINGLLLDHVLIEGGSEWSLMPSVPGQNAKPIGEVVTTSLAGKTWFYSGNPLGLRNWLHWAKPAEVIVFDEFQKFWPPRPAGAPIPPDLQMLDTHRHMGVDFILVTQNCMNVDRHILGLVDRHLHVRRVANMPLAVVYEWDHASKSLLYKNSLTKSPWRYDKSVFKLYKSAELHTKQKRKLPGLLWFVVAGLAGVAYAAPAFKQRLTERMYGVPPPASSPSQAGSAPQKQVFFKDGKQITVETTVSQSPARVASSPAFPASVPSFGSALPQSNGCIASGDKCGCFDGGKVVKAPMSQCVETLGLNRPVANVDHLQELPRQQMPLDPGDREVLAFAFGNRNKKQ